MSNVYRPNLETPRRIRPVALVLYVAAGAAVTIAAIPALLNIFILPILGLLVLSLLAAALIVHPWPRDGVRLAIVGLSGAWLYSAFLIAIFLISSVGFPARLALQLGMLLSMLGAPLILASFYTWWLRQNYEQSDSDWLRHRRTPRVVGMAAILFLGGLLLAGVPFVMYGQ